MTSLQELTEELKDAKKDLKKWKDAVETAINTGKDPKEVKEQRDYFQNLVAQLEIKVSIAKLEEQLERTTDQEEKVRIRGDVKEEKGRLDKLTQSESVFLARFEVN